MKNLVHILTGILMLMFFTVGAAAQTTFQGQSPPFPFGTPPTAVPLSGLAFGATVLLILLFVVWRFMLSKKKAGI